MKHTLVSLALLVALAHSQWVETTIPLPDSLSGMGGIGATIFHSPNSTIYVGGDSLLIAVDARTYRKLAGVAIPGWLDMMCSSTTSNKVYCASNEYYSHRIHVIDGATNRLLKTMSLDSLVGDMCYAATANKVYVACPQAVYVIDCETDSMTATIGPLSEPSALCYNPGLNRIYTAQSGSDEVAVIDCAADSVIRTIWVRGVEPTDICYDSVTNCAYTANYTSGTVSVIDCAGDSLLRIVATGIRPARLVAGPEGKVYCGSYYDSVLTVVAVGGTRAIPVGRYLRCLSYDPTQAKVYYATGSQVVVIDAIGDTVAARVEAGEDLKVLCYDPVGNSTLAADRDRSTVGVIDGATNRLTDSLWFGVFYPGVLRYNPVNNHLYCLEAGWNRNDNHLVVIDGDSNRVLKILPAGGSCDSMLWNPVNNKLYISNSGDNTVSIVDCTSDSIVATINSREDWPNGSCRSNDGKVYVCNDAYGVTVIDPVGDSVRKVIEVGHNPWGICYDRTDNKVYVGMWGGDPVKVIDVNTDSVVATVAVPSDLYYQGVRWNQNHDKVYVSSFDDNRVVVIDCAADTVLKTIVTASTGFVTAYDDSITDRVYLADADRTTLRILDAETDSLYKSLNAGSVGAMVDNGRPGAAHRLYSTGYYLSDEVAVVSSNPDSILRRIPVGTEPVALAWNPVHSWMYVSNSGSSSITVIRDTLPGSGVGDTPRPGGCTDNVTTVVRGILFLPTASRHKPQAASLLDIAGRKVLDLKPGANDVRALTPGVYFVREEPQAASLKPQTIHKVVVAR